MHNFGKAPESTLDTLDTVTYENMECACIYYL